MRKKYQLLMCLSSAIIIIELFMIKFQQNCIVKWKKQAEKSMGQFMLMNQWTRIKQEGKNLDEYFIRNNYMKIAVYGMGYIGTRLVKELRESEIEIVYGIDRNAKNLYADIRLITVDEKMADVDAVVVTFTDEFNDICEMLSERMDCPVISIDDIVNEI